MKARELLDSASTSFGPEAMKVIGGAYDEAWGSIAGNFSDGLQTQSARLRLASIILSLARDNCRDVEALKNAALNEMKRGRYVR